MIDLQMFCANADDDPRKYLHHPFRHGDHAFATNGHIMVRVAPRDDVVEQWGGGKTKIDDLWSDYWSSAAVFIPIKPFKLPDPMMIDCDECFESTGRMHECPDCVCKCRRCNGTGMMAEKTIVSCGRETLDGKYAAMLMALPGIEVCLPTGTDRMRFRFDGGEGILMLLRHRSGWDQRVADLIEGPL